MENTIIARNYKFENKELTKATTAIAKATESAAKSLLKIASVMAEVEARALYADDFKSIAEYGERVFGYKKSAVYNMVRIGRDYIDPDMTLREIENAVKEYNHKDDAAEGEEEPAEETEATAEVVEEEPDEIAMNFLSAKMALDRLVELFADDHNTAEILTEMKTRLEIIENGGAR